MFLLRHLWTTNTCMCGVNKTKENKVPPWNQTDANRRPGSGPSVWTDSDSLSWTFSRSVTLHLNPPSSPPPLHPSMFVDSAIICLLFLHFILLWLLKTTNAQELTGTLSMWSNSLTLPVLRWQLWTIGLSPPCWGSDTLPKDPFNTSGTEVAVKEGFFCLFWGLFFFFFPLRLESSVHICSR